MSDNINNLDELLAYFSITIKNEYNGDLSIKNGNSEITFFTDNAHDEVNVDADIANDDLIFTNTYKGTSTVNSNRHCVYIKEAFKTAANPGGNFCQYGKDTITKTKHYKRNTLFVLDVFLHNWLLGPNNLIDSAQTPNISNFYNLYGLTYNSASPDPLYNTVERANFPYTGHQNFDILNYIYIKYLIEHLNPAVPSPVPVVDHAYYTTNQSDILLINLNFLWQMTLTYCHYALQTIPDPLKTYYTDAVFLLRHINFSNIDINNKVSFKIGYTGNIVDSFVKSIVEKIDAVITHRFPRNNIPVPGNYHWNPEQPICASAIKNISQSSGIDSTNVSIRGNNPKKGKVGSNNPIFEGVIKTLAQIYIPYAPAPLLYNKDQVEIRIWGLIKFTGDTSHIVFAKIIQCAWNSYAKKNDIVTPGIIAPFRESEDLSITILTGERPMMSRCINHNLNFWVIRTFNSAIDCADQTPTIAPNCIFSYTTDLVSIAKQKVTEYKTMYNATFIIAYPAANTLFNSLIDKFNAYKSILIGDTDPTLTITGPTDANAILTVFEGITYKIFYELYNFLNGLYELFTININNIKAECINLRNILTDLYNSQTGFFIHQNSTLQGVDINELSEMVELSNQYDNILNLLFIKHKYQSQGSSFLTLLPPITVAGAPVVIDTPDLWYTSMSGPINTKISEIFTHIKEVILKQCLNKSFGGAKYKLEDSGILSLIGSIFDRQVNAVNGNKKAKKKNNKIPSTYPISKTTELMEVLRFVFSGLAQSQNEKIQIMINFIYKLFVLSNISENDVKNKLARDHKKMKCKIENSIELYLEINLYAVWSDGITCETKASTAIYMGGAEMEETNIQPFPVVNYDDCLKIVYSKIDTLNSIKDYYIIRLLKHGMTMEMIVKLATLTNEIDTVINHLYKYKELLFLYGGSKDCIDEPKTTKARLLWEKLKRDVISKEIINEINQWVNYKGAMIYYNNHDKLSEIFHFALTNQATLPPDVNAAFQEFYKKGIKEDKVDYDIPKNIWENIPIVIEWYEQHNYDPHQYVNEAYRIAKAYYDMSLLHPQVVQAFNATTNGMLINYVDQANVDIVLQWYQYYQNIKIAYDAVAHTSGQFLPQVLAAYTAITSTTHPGLINLGDQANIDILLQWYQSYQNIKIAYDAVDIARSKQVVLPGVLSAYTAITTHPGLINLGDQANIDIILQWYHIKDSNIDEAYIIAKSYYDRSLLSPEILEPYTAITSTTHTGLINYHDIDNINIIIEWYNTISTIQIAYEKATEAQRLGLLLPEVAGVCVAITSTTHPGFFNYTDIDNINILLNWYQYVDFFEDNDYIIKERAKLFQNNELLPLDVQQACAAIVRSPSTLYLYDINNVIILLKWYNSVLHPEVEEIYKKIYSIYHDDNDDNNDDDHLPSHITNAFTASIIGLIIVEELIIVDYSASNNISIVVDWYNKNEYIKKAKIAYTDALAHDRLLLPPQVGYACANINTGTSINYDDKDNVDIIVNWSIVKDVYPYHSIVDACRLITQKIPEAETHYRQQRESQYNLEKLIDYKDTTVLVHDITNDKRNETYALALTTTTPPTPPETQYLFEKSIQKNYKLASDILPLDIYSAFKTFLDDTHGFNYGVDLSIIHKIMDFYNSSQTPHLGGYTKKKGIFHKSIKKNKNIRTIKNKKIKNKTFKQIKNKKYY
jgi:hypothetical protein